MELKVMPPLLRRATLLATVLASAALVAGCGSSTVFSSLVPTGMVVMGDGLSDLSSVRYTVNDGSSNIWAQQLAASYGVPISQGLARGNARVVLKPDAAGNAATATIAEQVDAFLASGPISKDQVILLGAGISDLVVQADAVSAGSISAAQAKINAADAGTALAAQVRRLVNAGGTHVVVAGAYNLGKSPYATAKGTTALLDDASLQYNTALLVAMNDLGANVLYIDAAFRYNQLINQPTANGFANAIAAACTTPTASTCTQDTIGAGISYNSYVFADDRYFTPAAQRAFGDYAFARMKTRW
jgi:outer membrane lipase/esterase